MKRVKEQLKTYEHDLAQETDTLYGDIIYKALDRRCKSKKRPSEISREMQSKLSRLELPFRVVPSRGYLRVADTVCLSKSDGNQRNILKQHSLRGNR